MDKVKIWNWKQSLILLVGILCLAVIGCDQMLMDELTPAVVDSRSNSYVGEDEARTFTTLARAKELRTEIGIKHRVNLLQLRRDIEDDENAFQDAILIDARIEQSERWQNIVVGSAENPMSLMGILAGTSLGGLIGYRVKRKGDLSPEEVAVEVEKVKIQENGGTDKA